MELPKDKIELLTVEGVAETLKLSAYTVRQMLKDGRLRGVKMSERGQWRVRKEDLDNYLKQLQAAAQ